MVLVLINNYSGLIARIGFAAVRWKARRGLSDNESAIRVKKQAALRVGVRGETYAYWYLRRMGYVFIARNFTPSHAKGELDLIGYDGDTLAIVDVRTRLATPDKPAQPEMSISRGKHEVLIRTAEYFVRERHILPCPVQFEVVAIDNVPGHPVVRLHKAAQPPIIN
jgi:Holliday junction resolvase-like predicted endonuclease